MALNTQVPEWLNEESRWYRESGERSTQNFVQSLFESERMGMQRQQQKLNLASSMLGIEQQKQGLELGEIQMRNYAADTQSIPEWLKDHPTWESRQDAEWPTAASPQWQKQLTDLKLRDSQSVQAKVAVSAANAFSKRVTDLSKTDPSAAGQFAPYIGKANIPSTIQQALAVAEQTAQLKAQNQREQAAIDAQARGDVPTTKITEKGVETTYKAPTAASKTSSFTPDEPIKLSDGSQLIHVSPNKWQYVKGNNKTDLTSEQKRNIAHELLNLNPKDPRGLTILNELADMAQNKKQPTATPQPASTNAPAQSFKVGNFTVTPQ